jgi:hypothetical protein
MTGKRLSRVGLALAGLLTAAICAVKNETKMEAQWDKLGILHSGKMLTDRSEKFITVPADYPDAPRDFDVAKTAPSVDFAIIQGLEPWVLPPPGERTGDPGWAGWGDVTKGPDGCFYFSIGNHMYIGAKGYVVKYDPTTKTQSMAFNTQDVLKWGPDDFGDSKLHGHLDVGPDGDMWILTFFGPYYTQKYRDRDNYRGSYLLNYNVFTKKVENLGVPMDGATWPYHHYDWDRGILFGVSHIESYVLVYDTKARKIVFAGAPPNGLQWYNRGLLLDRNTGKFYSSDTPSARGEVIEDARGRGAQPAGSYHLISYTRKNNRFDVLKSEMPRNPVTGRRGGLRATTDRRDPSGAYWLCDNQGTMFKFYPDQDRVELKGVNWGKSGQYMTNMSVSPKGRYLYYVPHANMQAYKFGTPVIQYDTQTDRKKVIAFLNDFYLEKYGYSPAGVYGIELDAKGESLFLYTEGQFTTKQRGTGYGRPAICDVHIPASERVE